MIRLPIRGGNWNNTSNAGVAALNLNNDRTNRNTNRGFRPALYEARSIDTKVSCQCNIKKDALASAIAEKDQAPADASAECLYEQIYQFENILSAAYQCRKGKSKKQSTLDFFDNLEENVIQIQNELMWNEFTVSPYHHFFVFEPKRRLISAPTFYDRVAHRAIYNIIEPICDKTYIYDSYACRRNKGAHKGADRAQAMIRKVERKHGKAYVFKADIYRYFSSIDHEILKRLVAIKIKCTRTQALLNYIIDHSPSDGDGVGIPLGNLTSQVFANIYLNELDRFMKHTLKVKNYCRYMDDFVVISGDKKELHRIRNLTEEFVNSELKLKFNSKTQVFPIGKKNGRALDFLGYRMYGDHRLLRKSSVKRIKRKITKYRKLYSAGELSVSCVGKKIQSWIGHASHANSFSLIKSLFNQPFVRSK
ncbi:MAG: reverse transcriptase domain-containing protein [Vibrio litoralis]